MIVKFQDIQPRATKRLPLRAWRDRRDKCWRIWQQNAGGGWDAFGSNKSYPSVKIANQIIDELIAHYPGEYEKSKK